MTTITGTTGNDTLTGTGGIDTIDGGDGNDILSGGDGNDTLKGGVGNDTLNGNDGDDVITDDYGTNSVFGGEGNDVLSFHGAVGAHTWDVMLDGGNGNDTLSAQNAATATVTGGAGNDQITAGYSANALVNGGDGNDWIYFIGNISTTIDAGSGDDLIQSFGGDAFTATGGTGRDTYLLQYAFADGTVRTITDFTPGNAGDIIDLTDIVAWLSGYAGSNPFATGHVRLVQSGPDTLLQVDRDGAGSSSVFATLITLKNVTAATLTAANFGGYATDGTAPPVTTINGTTGNDPLTGTVGDDTINGGDGSDTLKGRDGNDTVNGGADSDTIDGGVGNDILNGNDGDDHINDDYGVNSFFGGEGNDGLAFHGATASRLWDTFLDGGNGNDTLSGQNAATATLTGGAGDDLITAGYSNSALIDGGDGNDWIYLIGNSAATIDAGSGDDIIQAFGDTPFMATGGTGRDTYVLQYAFAGGTARIITDFTPGNAGDIIDLSDIIANLNGYSGSNPFATGHVRLVQSGLDTLVQIDSDGAGSSSAFATLITLKNVTAATLTGANFGGYAIDGTSPPVTTINGTAGNDPLTGTIGNDTINGGDGSDTIKGGDGNDTINGGANGDTINGGVGNDILSGNDGDDIIIDEYGTNSFFGGEGNDLLSFHGAAGSRVWDVMLDGGNGNDTLGALNAAMATIIGGAGDDQITASYDSTAVINGGDGNDWIYATSNLTTTIDAGSGDDLIQIFNNNPFVATGGTGRDTYLLQNATAGATLCTITDFAPGNAGDIIDLSDIIANLSGYTGSNPFATGHIRLVQSGLDTLLQVDSDGAGSGSAFATLITLKNVTATTLTNGNFGGYWLDGSLNHAPTGGADAATVLAGGPRTITLSTAGLLGNDSDIDGNALTITGVGTAGHGTATFSTNGTATTADDVITYTPTTGYSGADTFTYTLSDGTVTTAVNVNITVQAAPPTSTYTAGGSGNDVIDKSGQTGVQLITGNGGNDTLTGGSAGDTLNGGDGNDVLNGGAGLDQLTGGAGADQFILAKADMASGVDKIMDFTGVGNGNVAGDDQILLSGFNAGATLSQLSVAGTAHTYRVTDGAFTATFIAVYSGSATLVSGDYLFVNPTGPVNTPPVAGTDNAATVRNTTLNLTVAGLLANDSDADGNTLSLTAVGNATNGTVTLNDNGTAGNTGDDYVVFTPTAGFTGAAGFTYSVSDGFVTATGTVNVTVTAPANSLPVANTDAYSLNEDTVLNGASVLGNDSDADGQALTAQLVSGPSHGSLALNANGTFTYTPVANYNGADSFTYKASDGIGTGNTATVNLTVAPVNDLPVVGDTAFTVLAGGPRTVILTTASLLANVTDVDGDALFLAGYTTSLRGTVTFNTNGTATTADDYLTYTPPAGYSGSDGFVYIVSDGGTTGVGGWITVTVQAEAPATPVYTGGTAGNDTYDFSARTGVQTVAGNGGNDTITAGSAADVLNGGEGNDTLNGGTGKDQLTGGNGLDTFVFASADGDKIIDFVVADDTIALSKATFGTLTGTAGQTLLASEFVIGAAATTATQHVIYNATTGALYYDADGNGAGAMVQIALMSKSLALTQNDFLIWA